jgi:hypothetical protein
VDQGAFAELLVREGLVERSAAERLLGSLPIAGCRIDSMVLLADLASEDSLLDAIGRFTNSRTASRGELRHLPQSVTRLIPRRVAERFGVVPFRLEGKRLSVAALDPSDLLVEDELRLLTGCTVSSYAALEPRVFEALAQAYGSPVPPVLGKLLRPSRRPAGGSSTAARVPASAPVAEKTPPPSHPLTPPAPVAEPVKAAAMKDQPLELSDEELGMFPTLAHGEEEGTASETGAPPLAQQPPSEPASPEDRLDAAASALQQVEMRDDIGDVLLEFCAPYLRRRALFIVRKTSVVGWRGEGEGVEPELLRAVDIPVDEVSLFHPVLHGAEFWLGSLPPMPRNTELIMGLGGDRPTDCLLLPVRMRSRIVCFLYGDNLTAGVGQVPLVQLRRLVAKAALAFEAYILRNKIRQI